MVYMRLKLIQKDLAHPKENQAVRRGTLSALTLRMSTTKQTAQKILQAKGYSASDAEFAVDAIYRLNEGFDGEPVSPDWLAKEAAKRSVSDLKTLVDKYC